MNRQKYVSCLSNKRYKTRDQVVEGMFLSTSIFLLLNKGGMVQLVENVCNNTLKSFFKEKCIKILGC